MDDVMPPAAQPRDLPEPRASDLAVTMAFDPMAGIADLEDHLTGLKDQASALGYRFDRHAVRNELQAATFRLRTGASIRLLVSPTGALAIETTPQR
jgi:para-aminobenzoate synthetase/4-amino-4-deoxychorismate lyase